jgi:hypothetical protein
MPEPASRRLPWLALLAAAALAGAPEASARAPVQVDRVPARIPARGVEVTGVIVLTPPAAAEGLIPAKLAVEIAHFTANPRIWRQPETVRATVPGPIAIAPDGRHWVFVRKAQAWVVTFTATSPQQIGVGPAGVPPVSHMSVILNARDGRFIRGFFTR